MTTTPNLARVSRALHLARLAYHSYGQSTDFKNFQGNHMPEWEDLGDLQKQAWVDAAAAVERTVEAEFRMQLKEAVRGLLA